MLENRDSKSRIRTVIAQLNEEKQSLEAELENANCEIEELKNQQLNSAEAAKMETQI